MPELPEVETIRRALEGRLIGTRVVSTQVRERRLRRCVSTAALRGLEGQRFVAAERRAKYLMLSTDGGRTLVIHLGMTGRVDLFSRANSPLRAHDHVCWILAGGRAAPVEMRYHDPRRFGLVACMARDAVSRHPMFVRLGPEPLGPRFDGRFLRLRLAGSGRPVKNALMDASVVVGVGNIYASEALWRARVNPRTRSARVGMSRCERLAGAVIEVLSEAIEQGGTTLNDYRDPSGQAGYFRVRLDVYGRDGSRCRRCGGTVRRIVQAGRATFYCPGCQH